MDDLRTCAATRGIAPVCQSGFEFEAELETASRSMEAIGSTAFTEGVLSGAIARTGANCFRASLTLLRADAPEEERIAGMRLLADAFRSSGHLDVVASRVRDVFAAWRDRAVDAERWRDRFCEYLAENGAIRCIPRFNTLLDGSSNNKIFIIGANKTGTTSLHVAMQQTNVLCGPQNQHEMLFRDWADRRFDRITELCRYYEAFQDLPFSLPFTYQALDQAFPDARFILSVRDSSEQWYESLIRHHRQVLFDGELPRWELIDQRSYCYPELLGESARLFWRWPEFGLYDKQRAIDLYERHNQNVIDYFSTRDDKLLVINLSQADSYAQFARFLELPPGPGCFGIYNRTSDLTPEAGATDSEGGAAEPVSGGETVTVVSRSGDTARYPQHVHASEPDQGDSGYRAAPFGQSGSSPLRLGKRPSRELRTIASSMAIAAAAVGVAVLITETLKSAQGGRPTLYAFYALIAASGWLGGFQAGWISIVFSALAVEYFFMPPINSLTIEAGQLPAFCVFLIYAALTLALTLRGGRFRLRAQPIESSPLQPGSNPLS